MRFTDRHYEAAISCLQDGGRQLEADAHCCAVCGDSGHVAFECGHDPLVAMALCERIAADAKGFHEALHWLAGEDFAFGLQRGPAKVVLPARGD